MRIVYDGTAASLDILWRAARQQSLLLARETGLLLNIETMEDALRRVRDTPSQARASSEDECWANVENAFQASPDLVGGKRVIILDYVCATGSTLEACSLALKTAGAVSIQGLTQGLGKHRTRRLSLFSHSKRYMLCRMIYEESRDTNDNRDKERSHACYRSVKRIF